MEKTKVEPSGETFTLPSGIQKKVHDGVTTYHHVPLAHSGVKTKRGKRYYRSVEALKRASRFNMRVISPTKSPHPPEDDLDRFINLDLSDEDYTVIGSTSNQEVVMNDDGVTATLFGDINIDDSDDAGNSTAEIITSWGIVRHVTETPGTFQGEAYDAEETLINPYHLTLARPGFATVCGPDCGPGAPKGEAEDLPDSHGGDTMPDDETQTPPEGEDTKPLKKKGAEAPTDDVQAKLVDSMVEAKEVEREKARMAEEMKALKEENERLKEENEAGKQAIETLTTQDQEKRAGLREELEKTLGEDGLKELYGEEGIPEDATILDLNQALKLAKFGTAPEAPSGEAEEVVTGTSTQFKAMPHQKPKPKGEGDVKGLTELAKYKPPNPRNNLEEEVEE